MADNFAVNYLKVYLERQTSRKFRKGEIIVFQGEVPEHAYAVKSGIIKAYNLSVNGDEKPVAFYPETYVFPATWIYEKLPSAIYYYEAFTDNVEVYMFDRSSYVKFIKKSPELLYQEMEHFLNDHLGGSMRLNALEHSKASDKLIYTLHYLAISYGQPLDSNSIQIALNLTHQDFANLTGLTRETAATELNKLKKQGIIDYGKNQPYILRLNLLLKKINDQFIADLKPATLVS
jgi:CRP/FNR family transcriptional regulator